MLHLTCNDKDKKPHLLKKIDYFYSIKSIIQKFKILIFNTL